MIVKRSKVKALLSLSMLSKISTDNILKYFSDFFFPETRISYFKQIVSLGDNLHENSNLIFWGKMRKKYDLVVVC